ncbi:hypothetical protein Hanom_Chr16g01437531 [Helianthus anomalus]
MIDEAPHPEGPRRALPSPVDPLHDHTCLESTPSTDAARFCGKFRRLHVGSHAPVDWDALEAICETPRLRYFIPIDSSWHPLFELVCTSSYRELLVEFLSTFTFHPPRADQQLPAPPPTPEVSFRHASVWRSMTLAEFSVHSRFWHAGADTWEHIKAKGRISYVDDPLYRMLSTSITARGHSREWCMSTDLVFFYRRPCALAHSLAQYFAAAHHRQEHEFLYGRAYLIVIARSLCHLPEADTQLRSAIAPMRMGFMTLWGMKLIKRFDVIG